MLDDLIETCAGWDWVTPLWTLIQDWRYGPPVRFYFHYRGGFVPADVEKALREKGVRTWGLMVLGDYVVFSTSEKQGRYAAYLLGRRGVGYWSSNPELVGG